MRRKDTPDRIKRSKRVLEKLRESEIKYQTLFDNANDAIFLIKGETLLDCNQKFLDLFGCVRNEVIGQSPYRFSPPFQPDGRISREKAIEMEKDAISGKPQSFQWRHCRYDGTVFDAEVRLDHIELDKNIRLFQAIVRDTSERKEAKDRLRISEEKYRGIFENAMEGIFQVTPEGRYITANPALVEMYGYNSVEGLIDSCVAKEYFVNPEDYDRLKNLCDERGSVEGFEAQIYRKNGSKMWVSVKARAIRNKNGETLYYEGMMENATRRKETESALRASEERYQTFIDSTSEGVFLKDQSLKYVIVNEQFRKFFSNTKNEIIGRTVFDLLPAHVAEEVRRTDIKALESSSMVVREEAVGERIYEIRKFPVMLEDNTRGVGGFAMDITERKKAEKELEAKSINLEEVNAALRVLLKQRDQDRSETENKILGNLRTIVLPYLKKLKMTKLSEGQEFYVDTLEKNLDRIASGFIQTLVHMFSNFTPTEIQVASLLRNGMTVKEIARVSGVSENAIQHHRQNLRKKLGLSKQKISLKTYLMSLR